MDKIGKKVVKGIDNTIGYEVNNYLFLPVLGAAADITQVVAGRVILPSLALTKGFLEYGVAKPLWWGVRGGGWVGAHAINFITREACGHVPSPNMDFNFPGARPDWMNWAWNDNGVNAGPLDVALRGCLGWAGGNARAADLPWAHEAVFKHLWRVRPENRLNQLLDENGKFDPNKLDKFVEPLSEMDYHEYADWMCQQMCSHLGTRLNEIRTPRMNAARTHYIRADGTGAVPINAGINNDGNNMGAVNLDGNGVLPAPNIANIRAILNAGGVAVGNIPAANRHAALLEAASQYYEEPDLWKGLNAVDAAGNNDMETRKKTLNYLVDLTTMKFKQEHYRLHERIKQKANEKLFKRMQDKLEWVKIEEQWLKFLNECETRSYGLDELIFRGIGNAAAAD